MDKIFEQHQLDGRAEIAAAMDVLMRHLNDEEVVASWLQDGVPDDFNHDAFPADPAAKRDQFMGYVQGMSDEEWEGQVKLFAGIVKGQCYKTVYKKGAFF